MMYFFHIKGDKGEKQIYENTFFSITWPVHSAFMLYFMLIQLLFPYSSKALCT